MMNSQQFEIIKSRSNERIKKAVAIRKSSRERRKNGLFFLEGARLCSDAAMCGTAIEVLFFSDKAFEKYSFEIEETVKAARSVYRVSQELCDFLSETESPQGVFCVCQMSENSGILPQNGKKYIALDDVQNPDNLGAVARTAEALGIDGMIVFAGCDIYNPKAQRAAMGSLLRLPVIRTDDLCSLLKECRENGLKTYATTPDSSAEKITKTDFSGGVVCVIGNEGAGISKEVLDVCDTKITIPMKGRAESLNAAAAASVLLWEMVRE